MTSCSVYDDILPRGPNTPSSDVLNENTGNEVQLYSYQLQCEIQLTEPTDAPSLT